MHRLDGKKGSKALLSLTHTISTHQQQEKAFKITHETTATNNQTNFNI